jgi:hypothetical protein
VSLAFLLNSLLFLESSACLSLHTYARKHKSLDDIRASSLKFTQKERRIQRSSLILAKMSRLCRSYFRIRFLLHLVIQTIDSLVLLHHQIGLGLQGRDAGFKTQKHIQSSNSNSLVFLHHQIGLGLQGNDVGFESLQPRSLSPARIRRTLGTR